VFDRAREAVPKMKWDGVVVKKRCYRYGRDNPIKRSDEGRKTQEVSLR